MAELDTTKFHRQLGIVDPELLYNLHVRIIGTGAVGSAIALILAKMGVGKLELFDPDKVEEANLPNQFFRRKDLGQFKTVALADMLKEFTEFEVISHPEPYDVNKSYPGSPDVVICGVDSMDFRKNLWEKVIKNRFKPTLYIETRMGAEEFRIYSLPPLKSDLFPAYEQTLYSEKEAAQTPCTEKAIIYNVMMIGSMVGSFIKMYVTEGVEGVPFEVLGNILNSLFMVRRADQVTPTLEVK